jgi:hypothetical protein
MNIETNQQYDFLKIEVINFLSKKFPNDQDFGREVRKLISHELMFEERELNPKERYEIWFMNNYQTGFEYNSDDLPDFDNEYWEPTPTKEFNVKCGNDKHKFIL